MIFVFEDGSFSLIFFIERLAICLWMFWRKTKIVNWR